MSIRLEELVLEFHPLQSQSMQKALHQVHAHQDPDRHVDENGPANEYSDKGATFNSTTNRLFKENLSQLTMGQTQSPQSKVRGGVGNTSQNKLNGLDDLVDKDFAEFEFLVMVLFKQSLLGFFAVSLLEEDEGLGDQHNGDHDEGNYQEVEL